MEKPTPEQYQELYRITKIDYRNRNLTKADAEALILLLKPNQHETTDRSGIGAI